MHLLLGILIILVVMYQFKGTVGIFYVLAALYEERAICEHIFDGKSSVLLRAVLARPTQRVSGSSRKNKEASESHQRGRLINPRLTKYKAETPVLLPGPKDTEWLPADAEGNDEEDNDEEDDDDGDDDEEKAHLRHEYQVMVQFTDDHRTKAEGWAAQLFATAEEKTAFRVSIMYAIPREKDADIRIVDAMMGRGMCAVKGNFELTTSAILCLAAIWRYTKHEHEASVRALVDKHYHAYQRKEHSVNNIIKQWRKAHSIPAVGSHTCDLPLQGFTFRPPYGTWETWVDTYIHHRHTVPFRKQALVLLGRTKLGKTPWARSLGPHIYMKKSFDMQKLHDCLAEGKAKYIVLDEFEWENITGKNKAAGKYGPAVVISDGNEFTWGTCNPRTRTKQTSIRVINSTGPLISNYTLPGAIDRRTLFFPAQIWRRSAAALVSFYLSHKSILRRCASTPCCSLSAQGPCYRCSSLLPAHILCHYSSITAPSVTRSLLLAFSLSAPRAHITTFLHHVRCSFVIRGLIVIVTITALVIILTSTSAVATIHL